MMRAMASDLQQILSLRVPIIVLMGEKTIPVRDVINMMPGTILELPKSSDAELELLVNNKVIGTGAAVKVGENFGIRINFVGDVQQRIAALGSASNAQQSEADAMADFLLSEDV